MPDKLESGRRFCGGIDYTHIGSRTRRMVVAGEIPNVDPQGWRHVAKLEDTDGDTVTNLSPVIVDSSGADQMSIVQTMTFFSLKVRFHEGNPSERLNVLRYRTLSNVRVR
jgi:hypothetical protein